MKKIKVNFFSELEDTFDELLRMGLRKTHDFLEVDNRIPMNKVIYRNSKEKLYPSINTGIIVDEE